MKLLGALPALKALGVIAVAGGFAGAIALGASRDRPPPNFAQQSTIPTPVRSVIPEFPAARPPLAFTPRPSMVPPVVTPRAVTPGLDKGGLFADGNVNLPKANVAGWKTYSNTKWGFSFEYPASWVLEEREAPVGFPESVQVHVDNPAGERGQNVAGVNCSGARCEATLPGQLRFGLFVGNGSAPPAHPPCFGPGDLVATSDLQVSGRMAKRCVWVAPEGDPALGIALGIPLRSGYRIFNITSYKGRQTTPAGQAILETILSTLVISP